MSKIAFIGLGSMGAPQARLIAKAGFDLAVYDPFPAAIEAFSGIARLATSAKDAASGAEIVGICVRDDEQVRGAIFGDEGAAAGIATGGLIVIHSTIRATTIRAIADELAPRGIAVIDAAVSRTRMTDDDKFVVSIVGGSDADFARARPVLDAFSTEIQHMGPLGAGVSAKIANNMITWTHIVVGMQAASMAAANGVALDQLRAILKANGNLTPAVQSLLDARVAGDAAASPQRSELLRSQTGIGQKDLMLAAESLEASALDPQLALAGKALVAFAMESAGA